MRRYLFSSFSSSSCECRVFKSSRSLSRCFWPMRRNWERPMFGEAGGVETIEMGEFGSSTGLDVGIDIDIVVHIGRRRRGGGITFILGKYRSGIVTGRGGGEVESDVIVGR